MNAKFIGSWYDDKNRVATIFDWWEITRVVVGGSGDSMKRMAWRVSDEYINELL